MAQKKNWSKEDIEKLIHIYEENSILWDSKDKEYRDREKKHKIFKNISEEFGCTSDEIQRKIHNLRNQVSQEMKKIKKKKSGAGTNESYYTSNWPYFSALKFLIPVLTANKTESTMSTTTIHSSRESTDIFAGTAVDEVHLQLDESEGNTFTENTEQGNEPYRETKEETKQTVKKRKRDDTIEDKLFKYALETLQKPMDDDDRFGQYVALELRGLRSKHLKRRLKSEIRRAIVRIVDEDDMYGASSSTISTPMLSPLDIQEAIEPSLNHMQQTCSEYYNNIYTNI